MGNGPHWATLTREDDADDVAQGQPGAEHPDEEEDAADHRQVRPRRQLVAVGFVELVILGRIRLQDLDLSQALALVALAELRIRTVSASNEGILLWRIVDLFAF